MKLALASAAVLALVAAHPARASETEDVQAVADSAGVDATDLAGAMATTGLPATEYLQAVGEMARSVPTYSVWDRIAACESHGNWSASTGNGFYGGVQFDYGSWIAAGGRKYAARADQASRAQQIEIADNWLRMTSWRSWPVCSRVVGLR